MAAVKKRSKVNNLSSYDSIKSSDALEILISYLKEEHHMSDNQINDIFLKKQKKEAVNEGVMIPVSIFMNKLSSLQIIVKYLHENLELSIKEISNILNRSIRTIYATYEKAKKKFPKKLEPAKQERYLIPVEGFKDRLFSPLEIVVKSLKDDYNLGFNEIADLLKRNKSTIWTVYARIEKKHGKKK